MCVTYNVEIMSVSLEIAGVTTIISTDTKLSVLQIHFNSVYVHFTMVLKVYFPDSAIFNIKFSLRINFENFTIRLTPPEEFHFQYARNSPER